MKWARDLFPFCRSLTGEGNRQTLEYIKSVNSKFIIKSFKSNKKVFDWQIPLEWKINDAYFEDQIMFQTVVQLLNKIEFLLLFEVTLQLKHLIH